MEPNKIKLKLSPNRLEAVCAAFRNLSNDMPDGRYHKHNRSIMNGVAKKLLKKQLDQPIKPIFVTMEYHEADILELFLMDFANYHDEHTARLMLMVANELNQKLA